MNTVLECYQQSPGKRSIVDVAGSAFYKLDEESVYFNIGWPGLIPFEEFNPKLVTEDISLPIIYQGNLYQPFPDYANACGEYSLIRLAPTLAEYIEWVPNSKYRNELRKIETTIQTMSTESQELSPELVADLRDSLGLNTEGDNYSQFLLLNLVPYIPNITTRIILCSGVPVAQALVVEKDYTYYYLGAIPLAEGNWGYRITMCLIRYAISKGFTHFDMFNVAANDRTAYKKKFFTDTIQTPIFARNVNEPWITYIPEILK